MVDIGGVKREAIPLKIDGAYGALLPLVYDIGVDKVTTAIALFSLFYEAPNPKIWSRENTLEVTIDFSLKL